MPESYRLTVERNGATEHRRFHRAGKEYLAGDPVLPADAGVNRACSRRTNHPQVLPAEAGVPAPGPSRCIRSPFWRDFVDRPAESPPRPMLTEPAGVAPPAAWADRTALPRSKFPGLPGADLQAKDDCVRIETAVGPSQPSRGARRRGRAAAGIPVAAWRCLLPGPPRWRGLRGSATLLPAIALGTTVLALRSEGKAVGEVAIAASHGE